MLGAQVASPDARLCGPERAAAALLCAINRAGLCYSPESCAAQTRQPRGAQGRASRERCGTGEQNCPCDDAAAAVGQGQCDPAAGSAEDAAETDPRVRCDKNCCSYRRNLVSCEIC